MPDLDPPHLGEVMRRLDGVVSQLSQIAAEMKQDRAEAAKTYVRQDLYIANRQADGAVVADLNGDLHALRADRDRDAQQRRQILMWLGGLTVTFLLGIAGIVVSIVTLVT